MLTLFETKLANGEQPRIEDALAAIREIDRQTAFVVQVDWKLDPSLASCRLQHLEERRRSIRRAVSEMVAMSALAECCE